MLPKYLRNSAKIALIAPSFGCTDTDHKTRLEAAIQSFEKKGYSVWVGPNCFSAEGICASNTPQKRAQEFMEAYESDADVIISVGGGETMTDILEYIPFEKIKRLPPKWFMGFSDNTNLTFTLTTLSDLPTIYGPNATHFCTSKWASNVKDAYRMLQGEKTFKGYAKFEERIPRQNPLDTPLLKHRKKITPHFYTEPFSGTLIGGNLDCLIQLCGTPFDRMKEYAEKHSEGIIFYFEACDLSAVGIRRALLQLKRAGWFRHIKGFLSGRPLCLGVPFMDITPESAVLDILKEYQVPILLNIDLGHIQPTMPMKNGVYTTVTYQKGNIFFEYKE